MSQDFINLFPFQNAEHWINDDDSGNEEDGELLALSAGTLASLSPSEQIKYLVDTVDEDILAQAPPAHQHIVRAFAAVAYRRPTLFHLATASSVNPDVFEEQSYASQFDRYSGTYGEITMRGVDVVMKAMHEALHQLFSKWEGADSKVDTRSFHLFDLGSGVGKVPLQAVLGGHFRHATGIELCPRRHQIAQLCLNEIERGRTKVDGHKANMQKRSIHFVEGCVTRYWTYQNEADAAYISNLLFGVRAHVQSIVAGGLLLTLCDFSGQDELNATVGRCLQHCGRLKVIVSILAIPMEKDYYRLERRVPLYVSWQDEPMQASSFSQLMRPTKVVMCDWCFVEL